MARRPLTARLKAENAVRSIKIAGTFRTSPPGRPKDTSGRPKYKWKPERGSRPRPITTCIGVPRWGRSPAFKCDRKTMYRLKAQGRPSVRCGRCRVLQIYRWRWSEVEPEDIVKIIRQLAGQGLIGPGSKAKSQVKLGWWAKEAARVKEG